MAGTVYVARGRGGSAIKARKEMQAVLDAGLPVVFFPEGTTTNGGQMLKFHSGLIAQAMESGAPITAAHIQYALTEENGPDVTVADDVCWGDDTKMRLHIFKFLGVRGVRVEVRFAERPIAFSSDVHIGRRLRWRLRLPCLLWPRLARSNRRLPPDGGSWCG